MSGAIIPSEALLLQALGSIRAVRSHGFRHKAFKTTAGFISIEADIVLCQSNAEMGTPSVNEVERASVEGLRLAYETRRFEEVTPDIN